MTLALDSINAILMQPIQSHADEYMVATFKDVYKMLEACGLHPMLHVLDNECSKAVQEYVRSEGITIQIAEPYSHRVNAAEPAVKSVKYHVLAGLATVHPDCPLQLWERFLA